jgi:hypothetical protein
VLSGGLLLLLLLLSVSCCWQHTAGCLNSQLWWAVQSVRWAAAAVAVLSMSFCWQHTAACLKCRFDWQCVLSDGLLLLLLFCLWHLGGSTLLRV